MLALTVGRPDALQNLALNNSVFPVTGWHGQIAHISLFLLHLFEVLLSAVRPRKHKLSPGLKSKRNLYKTTSAVSSFKYANGIDSNGVKEYPNYKKKWSQFRSSKQFHPIFHSGGKPRAPAIKRTESPVKNIVRKKLQLTDQNQASNNHVMSALEKLFKKHFSIFSYF